MATDRRAVHGPTKTSRANEKTAIGGADGGGVRVIAALPESITAAAS
ncbi:MAG TPA: hypothetical protein PKC59_06115 [Burkholderiaceae bacterium]|nr:hypothetical protein [Burkholderiaceae bacterium]HMX09383.1 hypothetical protein [Burkholderiaceae bacterium]HMY98396.1 hypothetical protein [Burkholderiaceae bacterium]HNB42776.1 hypothetical protein [Burkholderiaceae bacterium]HNG78708.1 hypothetical protein [Burkholderiaceae bacterium]